MNPYPRSLHLVSSLRLSSGGPTHSVPKLCEALNDLGATAEIATVAGGGEECLSLDRTPVHAFPFSWHARLRRSPGLEAFLDAAAPGFELIHVHGLWQWPCIAGRRAALRHGLPLVISPRGMLDPWALGQRAWLKQLALKTWEGRNLRASRLLHATSDAERDQLGRMGLDTRIAMIPNGVDVPVQDPALAGGARRTLLYLSRFHPKKGGDLLIQAWSRLWADFPDWRLLLVGPDEDGCRARWENLAGALGITAGAIGFRGPAHGPEKSRLLEAAGLFVLPSHSENFGNVIAEALAAGVPVITTTATPWSELPARACGWWVRPEAGAIEGALREAMALPEDRRRSMGGCGRDWMAADFSWSSVARRFVEEYQRLGSERSPGEAVEARSPRR